jgi:hypothetical protein
MKQITSHTDQPDVDSWKGILSAMAFGMHTTVHTATRATSTQLVFNRDAMHNARFDADWKHIKECKLIVQQTGKCKVHSLPI